MSEWQPIETAPKTGRPILLFAGCVEIGWWETTPDRLGGEPFNDWSKGVYDDPDDGGARRVIEPTHWQPLPEPPK